MARIEKSCVQCGGAYTVPAYRDQTAKYCSASCKGAAIAAKYLNTGPKPWAAATLDKHRHKSTSRFKPGHKTWNKDLKGIHLSAASEFKKGRQSETRMEIGTIRNRTFTRGHPRAYIKTAQPNTWKPLAVFVWEQHNGPLPKGLLVHHKDRNTLNDAIDNLQAMTRAEHMEEHRGEHLAAKAARQPNLLIPQPTPQPVQEWMDL